MAAGRPGGRRPEEAQEPSWAAVMGTLCSSASAPAETSVAYVENKVAETSANWLSRVISASGRSACPEPRPTSRLGCAGRPYPACFHLAVRRRVVEVAESEAWDAIDLVGERGGEVERRR